MHLTEARPIPLPMGLVLIVGLEMSLKLVILVEHLVTLRTVEGTLKQGT